VAAPNYRSLGELKGHTPEQSKPYQDVARLSTMQTQKNDGFERKYDMSIPGNIYIFHSVISTGGPQERCLGLSSLYKAIY
jgi:hypothetical protein